MTTGNLEQALNLQTGRIAWDELQRHFARGVVIKVNESEDLIEVAQSMVRDEAVSITQRLKENRLAIATTEDARRWNDHHSTFWAVVVAPWVLVQESKGSMHDVAEK
jgi:hypothetical protein